MDRAKRPAAEAVASWRSNGPALAATVMIAVGITALLFGRNPGPMAVSIVPLMAGGIIVTELISAYVLFGQAIEELDSAWIALAGAYQLSAFLVVPYVLTFPHAFAAGGLLGANPQTAVSLWSLWHAAFPLLVLAYAARRGWGARSRSVQAVRRHIAATTVVNFALAALATLVCTRGGFAPELVRGLTFTPLTTTKVLPVIVALDFVALGALWRAGIRHPTERWVGVAIVASALDALMGVVCARYTAGWYVGKIFSFASSSTLVVLFIFELRRTLGRLIETNGELFKLRERERQTAIEQLDATEARFRDAQEIAHVGTWEFFPKTGTVVWSDEHYEIYGVRPGKPIRERDFYALIHPDDRDESVAAIKRATERKAPYSLDHRILRPDGGVRWVQSNAKFELDSNGTIVRTYGASLDITERKEASLRLAYLAEHDVLTKLPNRTRLERRLDEVLASARRHGERVAVLFLDLDNFKNVNDSLGHTAGDRALQIIAERLRTTVRRDDLVSRMGGDEFVFVLSHCGEPSQVAGIAAAIMCVVGAPVELDGREIFLSASIGVSCYPSDGDTADALVRNADAAMYQAKAAGRSAFRFYTASMHEAVVKRLELERDLRLALKRDEFSLHYQPFLDLDEGETCRAEALLRWTHPERGNVPPAEFIPVAENCGLIPAIGEWVLERALLQLRRWQDAGRRMHLSVNVSMRELAVLTFPDRLEEAIRRHGVAPDCLVIEVTESTAMTDAAGVRNVLERCRRLGVRISVDDFGTDYSSLAYLARLPLDTLKIDRSFIADVTTSARGGAIVRAIIDMARSLELSTVAEGVETEEQLCWLRRAGCDFGQGFHIARPMPAAALEEWLDGRAAVTV